MRYFRSITTILLFWMTMNSFLIMGSITFTARHVMGWTTTITTTTRHWRMKTVRSGTVKSLRFRDKTKMFSATTTQTDVDDKTIKSRQNIPSGRPRRRSIDKSTDTSFNFSAMTPSTSSPSVSLTSSSTSSTGILNLHSIPLEELEIIIQAWGYPKYRGKQIYQWIHTQGITDITQMNNIPKTLQQQLIRHSKPGLLKLECEQISKKDGTIKRAYKLQDGSLIESVLMPYNDGRYTACISSQAGCAQGCVFCATGQMGFTRQLSAEEIFEQVSRFHSELVFEEKQEQKLNKKKKKKDNDDIPRQQHGKSKRLSNIVFMGMGEPLANYKNVVKAIRRIQSELGIGYRKITVSTVGIVPNIEKLAYDLPQVRLAVSLHCATDKERSELIPANRRYGGLDRLMEALSNYVQIVGRRVTLEWALIEGGNDTPATAHALGKLIQKWLPSKGKINNMVHVNVIPLNPTGGYNDGKPSNRQRVNAFCNILQDQYGVSCTPRVRRGIDIDAGCGQLTTKIVEEDKREASSQNAVDWTIDQEDEIVDDDSAVMNDTWTIAEDAMIWKEEEGDDDDDDGESDWNDYEFQTPEELDEAARLLKLVEGTTINTSIEELNFDDDHTSS